MNFEKILNKVNRINPDAPAVTVIEGERWPMINWKGSSFHRSREAVLRCAGQVESAG